MSVVDRGRLWREYITFKNKLTLTVIILSLLLSFPFYSYGDSNFITNLKSQDNPLNTQNNKTFRATYKLSGNAWVSASILKNGVTVQNLKNNSFERGGNHYVNWKGKDSRGSTVPAGSYSLKIAARKKKRSGQNHVRAIKVKVVNKLLFSESFNGADGLLANNYGSEDVLKKWKVTSQKFHIKNKRGYTDSPVFRAVTQKSDFDNFTLSTNAMKATLGKDAWDGLQVFFRYKDYDNLYAAGIRNDNALHLKKKVAGEYFELARVEFDSNRLNHWYNIKVVAQNDHIQVFVDEIMYIDVYDSSFSEGKVGARTDNITANFDDYTVSTQF